MSFPRYLAATLQLNSRGKSSDYSPEWLPPTSRCPETFIVRVLCPATRCTCIRFALVAYQPAQRSPTLDRKHPRALCRWHVGTQFLVPAFIKCVWAVGLTHLYPPIQPHVILSRAFHRLLRTPTEQSLSMLQVSPSRFR